MAKTWYLHVKDETMAPARMIQFIKDHVDTCDTCLSDPGIQEEIKTITELILPESKIPKAVRIQQEKENIKDEELNEEEVDTEPNSAEEEKEEYMDDDELEDEDINELD